MSFRRKTYDGDFSGGSSGDREWRDPFSDKVPVNKYAASKRAGKINESVDPADSPFTESGDKDRYLITYADLITLLLGLFIILYAISSIDIVKYKEMKIAMGSVFGSTGRPKPVQDQLNSEFKSVPPDPNKVLMNDLAGQIKNDPAANFIKLEENERGITIHIMDELLFKSGNADLNKESIAILDKIANVLKKIPNDIRIEGHTDNIPINSGAFQSNWHLSVARALNTAYFLIQNKNLFADKVSIVGYSEYKPLSTNETPEGRANNRRVDIVILKK